jgi:hypothetical protein
MDNEYVSMAWTIARTLFGNVKGRSRRTALFALVKAYAFMGPTEPFVCASVAAHENAAQ